MAWSECGQEDANRNESPMPRRVAQHMTTDVCGAENLYAAISWNEMRQAEFLAVRSFGSFTETFHSNAVWSLSLTS